MNNRYFRFLLPVVAYIATILSISYKLMPWNGGLNYTDSTFFFDSSNNFSNLISTWHPMFGGHDLSFNLYLQVPESILDFLFSFITRSDYIASYLTFFLPFLLVLLVANFVLRKIFKDYVLALLLPLFLVFNNFTLVAVYTGSDDFIMRGYLSSLIIVYICFLIFKDGLSTKKILLLALAAFITFHPFVYIVENILILIFFVYYLFFALPAKRLEILRSYLKYILISLGLSAFWILPFIYDSLGVNNNDIHGAANNLSVFNAYQGVSTALNTFSFIAFFNNVDKILYYSYFQYSFYFILFILCFLIFFYKEKILNLSSNIRYLLLFLALSILIFFDLSLGPDALISGKIFSYFWIHFSFFSFFRSFKRFFIPIPVLAMFLLGGFFLSFKENLKNVLLILFTLFILVLNYPLLSGNLLNSVTNFKIPTEYIEFNNLLLKDPDHASVIAFPYNSYEWYSWTEVGNKELPAPDLNWIQYYLAKPYLSLRVATYLITSTGILQNLNSSILENQIVEPGLSLLNVKYIMVNKDLVDGTSHPLNYFVYIDYFSSHNYPVLMNTDLFTVYLNTSYAPLITSTNNNKVLWNEVLPTIYNFSLSSPAQAASTSIVFLQDFSPHWQIYIYKQYVKNHDINLVLNVASTLFRKPISNNFHKSLLNGYGNVWTINSGELDGFIVFKTEVYFLLGSLCTIVSLILISLYLLLKRA